MNNKKLHERIIAGIVLVTLSLAAYAVEHGAVTGTGSSTDRAQACTLAKNNASIMKPFNSTITGYGSCDCSSSSTSWTCNVDAYWEKK
jgi:hypothetical protein